MEVLIIRTHYQWQSQRDRFNRVLTAMMWGKGFPINAKSAACSSLSTSPVVSARYAMDSSLPFLMSLQIIWETRGFKCANDFVSAPRDEELARAANLFFHEVTAQDQLEISLPRPSETPAKTSVFSPNPTLSHLALSSCLNFSALPHQF